MAMIDCPECGRRISDLAEMCLGCGISQKVIQKLLSEKETGNEVSGFEFIEEEVEVPVEQEVEQETGDPVRCCICDYDYYTSASACPRCKYPVFSVCSLSYKAKQRVKAYRKEIGMSTLALEMGQHHRMGLFQGERIDWRVIAVEDEKALLVSERVLDVKPYHENYVDINWEECTLKEWLNGKFFDTVFVAEEKKRILQTKAGQLFLLSTQEVKQYFINDEDRKALPTEYAKDKGVYVEDRTKCSCWWLRSSGFNGHLAAGVLAYGVVNNFGIDVNGDDVGVRPAMWLSLEG